MISPISAATSALGVSGVGSVGTLGSQIGSASAPSGSQSFGGALANALNTLESSQADATTAAQGLATGQIADPTQAITAVENASLAMDFAAQVRNQLDTAATTIFQTQV